MTQRDTDRLVVLKNALKKLIKQSKAAQELGISARQVKRLLRAILLVARFEFESEP